MLAINLIRVNIISIAKDLIKNGVISFAKPVYV